MPPEASLEHQPYAAVCVEVTHKDYGSLRGRRVIATDEAIVLFEPSSGTVTILSKKDARIVFLDRL